jgi:exosome complex component RRP41
MKFVKRKDGRKFDEPRKIEAKVGIIKRADGSAMFKIGESIAYAAVYGPRELHPGHLQNPTKGKLRCNYNMMAFSGSGERVRPGPSRRSKEIGLVTEKALTSVLDLSQYSNMVVDVFIELLQTDSGTRCAGICAAAMALADAGIPMKDMVSSIAVGKIGDKIVVDLTKEEEDIEGAVDIAVAFAIRKESISLLQLDGIISKDDLNDALKAAKKVCEQIAKIQVEAIKKKYKK